MLPSIEKKVEAIEGIFTFIFTFEMLIKICALGPKGYLRDSLNTFDGTLVLISLADTYVLAYIGV